MVLDYRDLNKETIVFTYPILNIQEILHQSAGPKYLTVFDSASEFQRIEVDGADPHRTSFATLCDKYEKVHMPFGLISATCTVQKAVDTVLRGLQGRLRLAYSDDVIIYAEDLEELDEKYHPFMQRRRKYDLKLQAKKIELLKLSVNFFGHLISEKSLRLDPKQIKAVKNFPVFRNVKNIHQSLGLEGYYRRFIMEFSKIAKPLSNLLQ